MIDFCSTQKCTIILDVYLVKTDSLPDNFGPLTKNDNNVEFWMRCAYLIVCTSLFAVEKL